MKNINYEISIYLFKKKKENNTKTNKKENTRKKQNMLHRLEGGLGAPWGA